jgi:plastocyanin
VRRAATAIVACLILAGVALPAGAATTTVSVVDFAFSPKTIKIAQGDTVQWHNTGTRTHTATQDAPLSAFSTGNIAPGATSAGKVLSAAGIYPYHCTIHPSMVGSIKVPVKVRPTSGSTATVFSVTVATQAAPTGFVYDVQQSVGDGSWVAYMTGVTTAKVTFQATTPGTYAFRSTLRKVSTSAKSKPSPGKTITVS